MLQSPSWGTDDCCCHIPYVLWVYVNGLASFLHDLNAWTSIHPFQASEQPHYVPQSSNYDYDSLHPHYVTKLIPWWLLLSCSICLVGTCQWIGKLSAWCKFLEMNPPLPGLRAATDCATIWQSWHSAPTLCYKALHEDLMIAAVIFHLPYVSVCQWIGKLSTWSKYLNLNPPLPGLRATI